ncbi:conserved protein of unknown function [Methylorubrum extorquens]|uniref:Uncharacterized protein n=1 Tax=Methylorubrum extorquens TaxID=408 RepID=A0A2N9AM73_METEX|nr:conserved protein of unknown function [Methylorubrum extorquens]
MNACYPPSTDVADGAKVGFEPLASGKSAKDARAYLYIGPSTRISPVVTDPGNRPHARSEITIGPLMTFVRETPEAVVRVPCVERDSS